jgi:Flp pilus assembly protein TadD
MRDRLISSVVIVAGVCMGAACVHHRPATTADRFLLHKEAKAAAKTTEAAPQVPSEEAIGKLRELMASARPSPKESTPTLETSDQALAASLRNAAARPTAENLLEVGAAYHRRGLLDQAYTYYERSLRLDSRRAQTHEAVARLWRDGRLPQLGLADIHRAIYLSPASAVARNTLGTLLQALGLHDDARGAYKMAVLLDRHAGYPFNNLCYLSFIEGQTEQGVLECQTALRLDPSLSAAHNNLGLIYAAAGRLDLARGEFALAGRDADAAYNMGIVYLAQNRYGDAAREFDVAGDGRPSQIDAVRRARDARRLADAAQNRGGQ